MSNRENNRDIAGLQVCDIQHVTDGITQTREEHIIAECPIALLYNGLSFAVMMATPCDLEDFALGFALGESIVQSADEFELVDVVRNDDGIALHAAVPQDRYELIATRRRDFEGRSGCGLCGVSSLREAARAPRRVHGGPKLDSTTVHNGFAMLSRHQPLNTMSGGAHAAGFVHGQNILVREDVGRHNALDKIIGAITRSDTEVRIDQGFIVITSRASYEIVHKAANAGVTVVAAISAPTDLAIRHAEASGLTLIAFAREGRMNIYTGAERIRHG